MPTQMLENGPMNKWKLDYYLFYDVPKKIPLEKKLY